MDSQRVDELQTILEEIRNEVDLQVATKLELDKCKRIIQRLSSFSDDCEECYSFFNSLEKHILQLREKVNNLTEDDIKQHKQKIADISSHLLKQHQLITSGYYLSIYMSIGTSLGLLFGLFFFENVALGLPIGMGIGVAIGAGLDEDAKKRGKPCNE